MPNYDFHCTACKHDFEEIVPIARNKELQKCPKCGEVKGERQVSAVAVNYTGFKNNIKRAGSGWNDILKSVKKASGKSNTIRTD
jgi:putative FmdB family regulatory protein